MKLAAAILLVATAGSAWAADETATFLAEPNFPKFGTISTPLPVIQDASPGDGLGLSPGAHNAFSLVMGSQQPHANLTTAQSIRDTFFLNYLVGDLTRTQGSPMDTGQAGNGVFAAVARHYRAGDPNDVHVMRPDGMYLRAICSQNRQDCSPGRVWAGMVRVPFEIRPGMTVKVRYRSPAGAHAWTPIWMFSGSQISPGPGGNPYQGFGTSKSLLQLPQSGHCFEVDQNDGYPRLNQAPIGTELDFGTPNIYGVAWTVPPHAIYWADGNGYIFHPNAGPDFEQLPIDWTKGFHDLVFSWEATGHLFEFVDGKLVAASYMEYKAPRYADGFDDGAVKVQAMHLIIGNQAIPFWTRKGAAIHDNDGFPDGWTIVVQEISAWYGTVADPWRYRAAPQRCFGGESCGAK